MAETKPCAILKIFIHTEVSRTKARGDQHESVLRHFYNGKRILIISYFLAERCVYRERHPGFPERGWSLPSEIRCSAGDDFKPQLFPSLSGKVLCFLPRQNASGRRETERGAQKACRAGSGGKIKAIVTQNIDGLHQIGRKQGVF